MITRIKVKNFKSLNGFEIESMGRLVCLVGMNGTGKTSFLQLLDFLGGAMEGDASRSAIGTHVAPVKEFITAGAGLRNIEIQLDASLNGKEWRWEWVYNPYEERTVREVLLVRDKSETDNGWTPCFKYPGKTVERVLAKGSALALSMDLPPEAETFRQMMTGIVVLGVLDPEAIAAPAQVSATGTRGIERDGKGLTAYISGLTPAEQADFEKGVIAFYGENGIDGLDVKGKRFGWKRLWFRELGKSLDAVHLSYGILRYMALSALKYGRAGILAFDEVENGFNQEVMGKLLDLFRAYGEKQVFLTTHSGLLLNYFTDEEAKQAIYLLYKTTGHQSRAIRLFDIQEMADGLEYQGAGEVMSLANLREVSEKMRQNEVSA